MKRGFLAGMVVAAVCAAQTKSLEQGPHRMELMLERKDGAAWKAVDPGTIFAGNDYVRFRVKTNFDGYLYVMNHGTGGSYTTLFPREDTGLANRIQAGKEYVVPATEGAFRVDGPAGHDIVYWVLTPVELSGGHKHAPLPPPPPPSTKAPANLIPRCDDTILRARGDCVDSSAGAKAADAGQLPKNIKAYARGGDQDLVFMKKQGRSVVSSPTPLTGPVVYEFRLAHK